MNDRRLKQARVRMIAVSSAFLLGGSLSPAAAQICAPSHGDSNVATAEAHLQANDSTGAYAYLNLAREQGSGEGYRKTAEMFDTGRGVEPNTAIANHMYWFGAQSQDPESMFRTAKRFYERGFKKDGEAWATRAADCQHMGAVMLLVEHAVAEHRDELARSRLEQAIDASYTPAKLFLAGVYEKGQLGFERDLLSAFKWYYIAAQNGDPTAMSAVGYYFARGVHGVQDDIAAIHWYHEAAKRGHVESMTAYGWMVANGRGAQVDIEEARLYYGRAAARGDANATKFLGALAKRPRANQP